MSDKAETRPHIFVEQLCCTAEMAGFAECLRLEAAGALRVFGDVPEDIAEALLQATLADYPGQWAEA
jgi:hypothetical protein